MEENKIPVTEEEIVTDAPEAEEEPLVSECEAEATEESCQEPCNEPQPEKETKCKKKQKKAEAELCELKKALEQKDAMVSELNDKYLRLCAEYDNFRKRSSKEKEGIYTEACLEILEQILPVLDNLERAAIYNTGDVSETPMGKGLELTLKSFAETLSKLGVCEIEAQGKPFDPDLHNAVMHVDDESFGENEVVEVFMKGYKKGDKVIRYSMVKVAN